ncbi:kynurenine 3-monooxygenase, mitochondrial precursor [Aspergillus melleus]|uniref:Kynurenine 3-monooxygenase, mitochondrial n=1 Tax=Aspergillus melleus TaxID=138277 RepID=A0ACC3ARS7_9EURO|nr:kynurenine 3-monooxygenase, mitochondrial precursor [Aspergillus melleus]
MAMDAGAPEKAKIVIVGTGPVGSLAALYASVHHDNVEVYELRGDDRHTSSSTSSMLQKTINFTLSERGIRALEKSGRTDLLSVIMCTAIPMCGRIIHGRSATRQLTEIFHPYDVHGNSLYSLDRTALNRALRQEIEKTTNVKTFFHHKLVRTDLTARKTWLDQRGPITAPATREVDFDFLIGADGAHSIMRQ